MSYQSHVKNNQSSEQHDKQKPSNSSAKQTGTADRMSPFSTSHIAQLQRTIGNRAVAQLFRSQSPTPTPSEKPIQTKKNNTGMPDNLKSGVENLSGMSMDSVKVHYNSDKPTQLQALAYAQGNDIHVGPGQEQHLPHEAWHVVQQRQGRVAPTQQAGRVAINDDNGLESEADHMGAKASDLGGERMQMKRSDNDSLVSGEASTSSDTIQKVAATLYDGLDANDPTTYDAGGGHSYADHGAHTTEVQQRERLKSGTAPSGRVSKVPTGKAASKFVSDDKHKAAFTSAYSALVTKNAPKQKLVGMGTVISVPGAGVGYLRDGTEVTCDQVQLDIQPDNGKLKINTMFPVS
jgi:hypothetical protein